MPTPNACTISCNTSTRTATSPRSMRTTCPTESPDSFARRYKDHPRFARASRIILATAAAVAFFLSSFVIFFSFCTRVGSPPLLCVLRFYASAQLFMQPFRVVSRYEKRTCGQILRGATVSRLFIRFSFLCFVGRSGTSPDLEFRAFHTDGTRCRLFRAYFLSSNFIEPFCLCERLSVSASSLYYTNV